MPRYVKCQTCGDTVVWSDRFEKMEFIPKVSDKGRSVNKYYHKGECWDKHNKKQEFLSKEKKEQDELDAVVKEIHGVNYPLPERYWEMVQDIRNGTNRFKKFWKKNYKKGVPYHVIKEAYLMSRHDIEWAKLNKRFPRLEQELRYCLVVAHSKINDAHKKIKKSEQSKTMAKATEKVQVEQMAEEREVKFKKQKSEFDISHILGDD